MSTRKVPPRKNNGGNNGGKDIPKSVSDSGPLRQGARGAVASGGTADHKSTAEVMKQEPHAVIIQRNTQLIKQQTTESGIYSSLEEINQAAAALARELASKNTEYEQLADKFDSLKRTQSPVNRQVEQLQEQIQELQIALSAERKRADADEATHEQDRHLQIEQQRKIHRLEEEVDSQRSSPATVVEQTSTETQQIIRALKDNLGEEQGNHQQTRNRLAEAQQKLRDMEEQLRQRQEEFNLDRTRLEAELQAQRAINLDPEELKALAERADVDVLNRRAERLQTEVESSQRRFKDSEKLFQQQLEEAQDELNSAQSTIETLRNENAMLKRQDAGPVLMMPAARTLETELNEEELRRLRAQSEADAAELKILREKVARASAMDLKGSKEEERLRNERHLYGKLAYAQRNLIKYDEAIAELNRQSGRSDIRHDTKDRKKLLEEIQQLETAVSQMEAAKKQSPSRDSSGRPTPEPGARTPGRGSPATLRTDSPSPEEPQPGLGSPKGSPRSRT